MIKRMIIIGAKVINGKARSRVNNEFGTTEHAILNIKLIHVNFADIPSFSCLNNWQQLFDSDLLTGPIVQKENIGTKMIGGNLEIAENAFFIPTDEIRIPMA